MTAVVTSPIARSRLIRRGSRHRLLPVLAEIAFAVGVCFGGYWLLAWPLQRLEAAAVAEVLSWMAPGQVSGVLPANILIFPPNGQAIIAVVTSSCSSILSVVGLTALTAVLLRNRGARAALGLSAALGALLLLNHLRLLLSAMAGLWWGDGSLVLFHDWVGTLWNLAATLGAFLLLVFITLPPTDRAEQDADGRHIARRPDSWARPGLGYRAVAADADPGKRGKGGFMGFMYRRVFPRWLSKQLAARRESGRIDYRIGHLPAPERMLRVQELVADGLGAHTASLLAVATYERNLVVLDVMASAVAGRQWEPVTNARVSSLRLWAHGWLLARPPETDVAPTSPTGPAGPHPTIAVPRLPVPAGPTESTGSGAAGAGSRDRSRTTRTSAPRYPRPRTFGSPATTAADPATPDRATPDRATPDPADDLETPR